MAVRGALVKVMAEDDCPNFILAPDSPVPSPCFVIDAQKLRKNAAILDGVQNATGARILLALKAFAAFPLFKFLSREKAGPLWGTCASSVDEAKLGREEFGGEVHAFAAGWSREEMRELLRLADHITFNSLAQWLQFRPMILAANAERRKGNPIKCGLRINPEHSECAVAIYDPCSPGSRLGIRQAELQKMADECWGGLEGLHFHTLCEQNAAALARTLRVFEGKFGAYISKCRWLNWGGGHHITRKDYDLDLLRGLLLDWKKRFGVQIYLEPGEAVALDAGWLAATVLDVVEADMPVAILDVSAACHMPDVLEMPYRPNVWRLEQPYGAPCAAGTAGDGPHTCRLAGKSCLAGDVIGEYSFAMPLKPGDKLAFADMAIYSMVKTTTFNGLQLPSIGVYDPLNNSKFTVLRKFCHEDFKFRLG